MSHTEAKKIGLKGPKFSIILRRKTSVVECRVNPDRDGRRRLGFRTADGDID